ncbi:MAG: phosphate/phosphite/phosphonate ABC transporter substrate-binding protein [Pseudomonadota bacterium]
MNISAMIWRYVKLNVVLGVLLTAGAGSSWAAETYSFGVLNQQSPAATAALWNPILQYLQTKTGIAFKLRMGTTVQETDAMTARGEFDFLYSNHNFDPRYAQARYIPLAQWGGHPLVGQIVVNADSPIKTLADLEGKTVAFPSKDAFVAYQATMPALKQAHVTVNQVFGANQRGTAVMLQTNRADAASLNKLFSDQFQADNKIRFRVLYESAPWPNIPVQAHPRVPKPDADAVQKALVGMTTDPEGRALLKTLGIPGFLTVKDADYEATRRLYQEEL